VSLFDEIQNDIVGIAPLSSILRKAKVIAYRLKNQEFKGWVEHELNGYGKDDALPEYRNISTMSNGDFINRAWKMTSVPIPTMNLPSQLRESINKVEMYQGVRELESFIETLEKSKKDSLTLPWPSDLIPFLTNTIYEGMACIQAWRVITKGHISHILDNTRNRLLTFTLELAERYPDKASAGFDTTRPIPDEQIRQMFNYYVMGNVQSIIGSNSSVSQGDNMAIFDQRNQKVDYQYNAAGDINFEGVQNRIGLTNELEKFKAELSRAAEAGAIDAEIVTDAEYQIAKAIQQSKKAEPDKKSILGHISNAKTLIEGVAATSGMITALIKAAEIVQQLF
jgi:hypothetical protein